MPIYTTTQLARAYVHLRDRYPIRPLLTAVAQAVADSGEQIDAGSLAQAIAHQLFLLRRTLLAEVTTARPLSASALAALRHLLRARTGANVVKLETVVNPALIGGFYIRAPGLELDASVASAVEHIARL